MVFGDAESISRDKNIVQLLEKGQQTKTVSNRDEKDHAHFHINQYAVLNIALRLSKIVFSCTICLYNKLRR